MATLDLTKDNFEQTVLNNDLVILDFWAPWCGPCEGFAPVYEEISEKYADVVFAKVNTEEEQELAGYFQIRSIPTLMVFREKIIIFSQPGALPGSALEEIITKAKTLDMDQIRAEIAAEEKNQA
ncbi:MAG: thioredoxin [Betaproteobacteria bacterium RBG_19FT_COMBO_58_11]|nr:MAG: thioredoxin [Betaproteobacteria bacterium RBG_19FT_COMBO_58_11]